MTYDEWQVGVLGQIEGASFGAMQPMKPTALRSWLKESVPPLVLRLIVCGRAVKVCSTISPVASEVSLRHGHPIVVRAVPGHFYNIALTTSGPVKVDLSAIQFEVGKLSSKYDDDEDDPYGEEGAVLELLQKVSKNPFAAIRVEKLPRKPLGGIALPYNESFDYELAKRYVARLRKGRRRDALEQIALIDEDPSALATLEEVS